MKCVYCGYEIAKPNVKICPLCGKRVDQEVVSNEEEMESSEKTSVELESNDEVVMENLIPQDFNSPCESDIMSMDTSLVSVDDNYSKPSVNNEIIEEVENFESEQMGSSPMENIKSEDTDQYLENGSYQPYPDEEDYNSEPVKPLESQRMTWLISIVAAIVGLLLGAILYHVIE